MIGDIDIQFWQQGKTIIGFDEAGRGSIAGDMFFSLVELHPIDCLSFVLKDSKKYSDKKRFQIEDKIEELNLVKRYITASVSVEEINSGENLNKLLHSSVLKHLCLVGKGILFVDGNQRIGDVPQYVVPKLDENSWSCAVASIFAKNAQVRAMQELGTKYPEYGFVFHKGYGTKKHYEAIKKYGTCEAHRVNWVSSE